MGLGLFGGGLGAARFLAASGARVTVTDLRAPEVLAGPLEALAGLDVRLVLGRHDEPDFASADLVVASPAVRIDNPYLELARSRGVPVTTEIHLFLERCPAAVLAVTGSNGKSTTTSLLAAMVAAGGRTTWLGGNIGKSLLERLDRIGPDDRVVLELSSFMLEHLGRAGWSPRIAVVTNLAPNHLDWHGTLEAYERAKSMIVRHQGPGDVAILNAEDPVVAGWATQTAARVRWFALDRPRSPGLRDDRGVVRSVEDASGEVFHASDLGLRGRFNLANALAAAAAALADGVAPDAIRRAVREFRAVEHRLEWVARVDGADWYDDSVATTPESAIAALEALPAPVVVILGGHDKGLPLDELARRALERAAGIVLNGPMGPRMEEALRRAAGPGDLERVGLARTARLAEAVEAARAMARPGGSVVLSPATASYDEFTNFEARGRRFQEIVRAL